MKNFHRPKADIFDTDPEFLAIQKSFFCYTIENTIIFM